MMSEEQTWMGQDNEGYFLGCDEGRMPLQEKEYSYSAEMEESNDERMHEAMQRNRSKDLEYAWVKKWRMN